MLDEEGQQWQHPVLKISTKPVALELSPARSRTCAAARCGADSRPRRSVAVQTLATNFSAARRSARTPCSSSSATLRSTSSAVTDRSAPVTSQVRNHAWSASRDKLEDTCRAHRHWMQTHACELHSAPPLRCGASLFQSCWTRASTRCTKARSSALPFCCSHVVLEAGLGTLDAACSVLAVPPGFDRPEWKH